MGYMKRTTTIDYDLRQQGIMPPREVEPQHSEREWNAYAMPYIADHPTPAFVEEGPLHTSLEHRITKEEEPG